MLDSFLLRRAISRISLGLSSNQEDGAGVEVITGCSSSDMVNDEQREITSMTALSPWLEETPRLMQEIPLGPASVSGTSANDDQAIKVIKELTILQIPRVLSV